MIERNIYFIKKDGITKLGPDQITIDEVGGKAVGLCYIPIAWSVPFFVVSKELLNDYISNSDQQTIDTYVDNIKTVLEILNIDGDIILRSSAVNEGMKERGRFDSVETSVEDLGNSLIQLLDILKDIPNKGMPIIIQKYHKPVFTGHMSNERRFSYDSRDWKLEIYFDNNSYEQDTICVRPWRTRYNRDSIIQEPLCGNSKNYSAELQKVAFYWHELSKTMKCRFHLEFVYDGTSYFIVQADRDYPKDNAINPKSCNIKVSAPSKTWEPKALKEFNLDEPSTFNKLQNVKIYHSLGFCTVPFYFLNDANVFANLKNGIVCDKLKEDIETLLQIQSIVIRMDINSKDQSKKQMLPRSNEMRNYDEVVFWLKSNVATILDDYNGEGIFIFHNFVPSISSAFAHAIPNGRLVKIQSLWGLPEGLYYNYHDTIIVDLGSSNIDYVNEDNVNVTIKNKYKDTFISPDTDGTWVAKEIASPNDWNCSIMNKESIFDIAVKSQKIANEVKEEISVMWFVGIDKSYYGSSNMPWFHEKISLESSYTPDEYKRKYFSEEELIINNSEELQFLLSSGNIKDKKCFRVKPNCEKDLRNKELIKSIGELAVKHNITILLDGTQLTHTYYQLKSTGANVVCSNIDELAYSDTLEFNKLVRDKIPEKIISNGEHVRCSIVSRPLLDRLLLEKLLEEAYEVYDANTQQDIISELADMREIINTVQKLNNDTPISWHDGLNNKAMVLYDDYKDFKFYKFVTDPINLKFFKLGNLYGNFEVRRQKTIYRVEFNLQNYPIVVSPNVGTSENTEIHKCKLNIISTISKALNCKNAKVLMGYLKTANRQISSLCKCIEATEDQINQKMISKAIKVGGFEKGYVLNQTALKDSIIDDHKGFDPNDCCEIHTLNRDNNKYFEFLQNHEKKQKRILCRFSVPIAVNSWEVFFDSPKIKQLFPGTQCLQFEVTKNSNGNLILNVKTRCTESAEQLSIFDFLSL